MHILVVEDAPRMREVLRRGLAEEGHAVECADDGRAGLDLARDGRFDLLLLDLQLPGLDGLELLRRLRAARSDLPVVIVSARDGVADRVRGLDLGADDYLAKPFSFEELLARIRAVARRPGARAEPPLAYGDVRFDPEAGRAYRGTRPLQLSAREFALLRMFLRHPDAVLARARLYEAVWGLAYDGASNVLDVYVNYLRNKLEAGGEPRLLHTERGRGYRFGGSA